jgi:hypothetical protein
MISQFLANKQLDKTFRGVDYTVPALYVALLLHMAASDDSGLVEVSGVNYARQSLTFSAASARANASNAVDTFPAAGAGGWGTVIGLALYDALTTGNLLETILLSTGSSSLTADITSGATSVAVADGTKFAIGGTALIDAEQISITNIVSNTLTVTRAANGTTGASHSSGALVYALTSKRIDQNDVMYINSGAFTHIYPAIY